MFRVLHRSNLGKVVGMQKLHSRQNGREIIPSINKTAINPHAAFRFENTIAKRPSMKLLANLVVCLRQLFEDLCGFGAPWTLKLRHDPKLSELVSRAASNSGFLSGWWSKAFARYAWPGHRKMNTKILSKTLCGKKGSKDISIKLLLRMLRAGRNAWRAIECRLLNKSKAARGYV